MARGMHNITALLFLLCGLASLGVSHKPKRFKLPGFGAVKMIQSSKWNDYDVAIVQPNGGEHLQDFEYGMNFLFRATPHKLLVNLVGTCMPARMYVTQYYPRGNALNVKLADDDFQNRFKLCISYSKILELIHSGFWAPFVMCDSSSLEKTLSQYLLADDSSLVLNDVDSLQLLSERGIRCGKEPIDSSFAAPEQKGTDLYDEKSDIWKVPDVCNYFIGPGGDSEIFKNLRHYVDRVHSRCKVLEPQLRPTASTIREYYEKVYAKLFVRKEEL